MGTTKETDHLDLEAVADREATAMASGDVTAFFALLDEDAIFLPPNALPKHGAELRDWMRDFILNFAIEWTEFIHEETVIRGDLGYHRYTYSWKVTPKSGGERTVSHGKGIHIMRRTPGGEWRLSREIWNSSPSP